MTTKNLRQILEKELGVISFGGFLRAARTNKDLSQTEMADFLSISKSTLCDIEKGRQFVSLELASRIATRCGLSEVLAVEAAINDQLKKFNLKMRAHVKKISKSA